MKTNLLRRSTPAFFLALLVGGFGFALSSTAQPPPPGNEVAASLAGATVVDYKKLLPLLPEPPSDWKAEEAEGATEEMGDAQLSSVHRDFQKGEGDAAPTTSISILDSAANPEYVESTQAAWAFTETTSDGYTKPVTVEGMPGFETFENEGKHGTLWLLVAKRYFLQIETTGQDASELQTWLKKIDLKKLAEIK
ncbi:MAG: hypothetical protein M3Q89_12305 [Verrucomicrobiota bacterium]|nr:hypothetical protein [Verrucomicrobiota bacterium]